MKTGPKLFKPRWRKVLADLWEDKLRTVLVVTSIAVGVFAIGTIASSYVILGEGLARNYAAINPANIEIMTATSFEENFVRSVERIPGVAQAEGRSSLSVRVSEDGVNWLSTSIMAVKDGAGLRINQLKPVSGATVPGEHELLVSYDKMRDTGFRTGDWLLVQLEDGTLRRLRVAGEAIDQTSSHDLMGAKRAYVTEDTLSWLGGTWRYDRLLVRVGERGNDSAYLQSVADAIEAKIEKDGGSVYSSLTYASDEYPMKSMAMSMFGILGVLGALVLLLSSSLIVNTFSSLLAQHLRQIGVMKLVGARGRQVLAMYVLMILAFALLSLVGAIPLGAWAGYELSVMIAGMFNAAVQGFRFVPAAIVFQGIVAVGVPLVAGFIPVRNGSKVSVQRAISNDRQGELVGDAGKSPRLNRLGVGLLSRPILLSIRNTFRRKGRLALTLFTLTMAGAIFIAVFNVSDSMQGFIDQIMQHFMADVTLTFDRPYRTSRVAEAALQVPGVLGVEAWSGTAAEILDSQGKLVENLSITAPAENTALLKAEMVAGRWLQPGDQRVLVLSSVIYKTFPDLQPGDRLRLRLASDNRIEDWTVAGVFSFTGMLGDLMGYASYDDIADRVGTPSETSSYRLITTAHTLESQEALCAAIDSHLSGLGMEVKSTVAGMKTRGEASTGINILIVFLLVMALLTAFVGSIGLTGTMGMNVLERTREIGVMRAIGAGDFAIIKSVVIEGVLIGLISWAAAWALSYPISAAMLKIISTAVESYPIELTYTFQGVFIWLGAVVVLATLASVLPARNAARLTIREVLAYE